MNILKKIGSFLFEEDTEVYAEDELEEVVFSKEPVKEKKVVKSERTVKKERASIEKKVVNQPVKKEEGNKVTVQPKRFQSIDLQDVQEKTSSTISSKTESVKREINRKDYEFAPVISPMFGAKDEPVRTTSNVQPTILKARPKKRSTSVSSIISPMYGADIQEEEEQEVDLIEEEVVASYEEEQWVENVTEEDKESVSLDDEENEFVKSIPLEDLLQDEENSNEDTMQISLFGEDTPVREKEDTTDYTIKE